MNQENSFVIACGSITVTIKGDPWFIRGCLEKPFMLALLAKDRPEGDGAIELTGSLEELAQNEKQGGRIAAAEVVLTQRGHVNITETLRRLKVGQDVAIKTNISYVKAIASKTGHVYDYQRDGRMLRVRRVA